MSAFFVDGRTVLAVNNEYVNRTIIYGNRASGLPENADDVRKGKAGMASASSRSRWREASGGR